MYRGRGCWFSLCLAIFLFWVSHATAGQVAGHVDCHKYGCFLHGLAINGEIDDTTLSELKGLFESFDRQRDPKIQSPDLSGTRINLNSPGGSVAAAMAVGRSLRANRITAYVEPHASCLSSCVLVFAGAVGRFGQNPLSKVGIHQPYFPVPNGRVDADKVRKAYAPMLSEIRDYLKEMNVSEQLAAEMMKTAPSNVRYLTAEEQESYGLSLMDPIERETTALERAQKLGLDRNEYNRREALSRKLCPLNLSFGRCYNTIMQTGRLDLPDLSKYGTPVE